MGSHFGVGEFTTHFSLSYLSQWLGPVHWGLTDLGFDPWPLVGPTSTHEALKLALPDADMVIVEHQLQDAQDWKRLGEGLKQNSTNADPGSK